MSGRRGFPVETSTEFVLFKESTGPAQIVEQTDLLHCIYLQEIEQNGVELYVSGHLVHR